jgi:mRNA interferase MazF
MRFEPGELVLLAFPFSSETGAKQRPALVLLDAGDDDLVVARVTTQQYNSPLDHPIRDLQAAGLLAPSVIRLHKLATLEKALVRRRLGRLSGDDWSTVRVLVGKMVPEI